MAGRDNVLFKADVTSGASAGTVFPLSLVYGIENVRQGYGTPVLKSVRAYFTGIASASVGIPVDIKNSNWIDSSGVVAQAFSAESALTKASLSFMRGRDKVLQPNTSWIINATLPVNSTSAGTIYLLLEIEYSDVPGINAEKASGSPVMKVCSNASVTGSANVPVSIGTFDNLLQGVTYVMSEASITGTSSNPLFLVVEGFSNQKGLIRMIPIKSTGMCDQIEGSVYLNKQTYNLSVISSSALSSASVSINLEMVASQN